MTGRYTTQVPMLVGRQFDDEIILASFETGLYYSLIGTAADIWLGLKAGATKADVERAMKGHILAQAELIGKYGR